MSYDVGSTEKGRVFGASKSRLETVEGRTME